MEPLRTTLDSTDGQVATVSRTSSPPPLDVLTPPVVAEYWCHTQVRVTKMKYVWTISNFSFCREEMGEVVKSSFFSCGPNDKLKWCLRINPKGLDEESREYLSLYLLLVNCGTKSEARAKFKFSILNAKREETKAMESQRAYRFVQGKDWGFKKFIRRDVLMDEANGLLPNDRLTILCEVSVVGETLSESGQVNNQPIVVPECNLHEDIGSLWFRQLLTDVTLVVLANETHNTDLSTNHNGADVAVSSLFGQSTRQTSGKKYLTSFESAGEDDEGDDDDEDDDDEEEEQHDENEDVDEFDEEVEADETNMGHDSERDEDSQSMTQYTSQSGRSSTLPDDVTLPLPQSVTPADRDEAEAVAVFTSNTGEPPALYSMPLNPVKPQQPSVSTMSPATTSLPVPAKGIIISLGRTSTDTDRVKPPPHPADSVNISPATHSSSSADWRLTSSSTLSSNGGAPSSNVDDFRCDMCDRTGGLSQTRTSDVHRCRACRNSNPTPSTSVLPSTTSINPASVNLVSNGLSNTDLVGSTSNENSTTTGKVTTRSSRSSHVNPISKELTESGETSAEADAAASSRVRRSNRRRNINTTTTSSSTPTTCGRSSRLRVQRESSKTVPATSSSTTPTQSTQSTSCSGPKIKSGSTSGVATSNSHPLAAVSSVDNGGRVVLRQFEAHKAILAARSPVFAAMFEHGMEESRANRVEINDMEPDTLAEVLRYIYTGHVVGLDKLAHDLLAAADKYQLERLKIMCEEALVESLTAENCCDILVLADLHNAEQLKAHTLEFIMLHAHDVCETEGYEQLVRHRPRLLTECFRSLAAQQLPLRCSARKRPRQS